MASKEFAAIVGLSPEQYSRIENESAAITPMLDRMVRFVFAALAKLNSEVAEGVARVQGQAEVNRDQNIIATRDGECWTVKTTPCSPEARGVKLDIGNNTPSRTNRIEVQITLRSL